MNAMDRPPKLHPPRHGASGTKEARQFLYGSDGHPQDQGKALALFRTEALAGNDLAMYALAKLLLVKGEVSQDLSEALRWLRRSAELNNQFAQYRLGKLLFQGELLPQNVEEALQWLMASAQQGNQFAQYALGKLYLLGKEVPQDRDAAGRWLSLAAAQGNEYAQYFLDHMDDRSAAPLLLLRHPTSAPLGKYLPGAGTASAIRRDADCC